MPARARCSRGRALRARRVPRRSRASRQAGWLLPRRLAVRSAPAPGTRPAGKPARDRGRRESRVGTRIPPGVAAAVRVHDHERRVTSPPQPAMLAPAGRERLAGRAAHPHSATARTVVTPSRCSTIATSAQPASTGAVPCKHHEHVAIASRSPVSASRIGAAPSLEARRSSASILARSGASVSLGIRNTLPPSAACARYSPGPRYASRRLAAELDAHRESALMRGARPRPPQARRCAGAYRQLV